MGSRRAEVWACRNCGLAYDHNPLLEVACPQCDSDPGRPCQLPSGELIKAVHTARVQRGVVVGFIEPCTLRHHNFQLVEDPQEIERLFRRGVRTKERKEEKQTEAVEEVRVMKLVIDDVMEDVDGVRTVIELELGEHLSDWVDENVSDEKYLKAWMSKILRKAVLSIEKDGYNIIFQRVKGSTTPVPRIRTGDIVTWFKSGFRTGKVSMVGVGSVRVSYEDKGLPPVDVETSQIHEVVRPGR